MDILFRDYASWKMENYELIETLKNNKSILYDRIYPIYEVCDYLYAKACDDMSEIDNDMFVIFQEGFSYLHNQLDIISIYYENTFNKSLNLMKDYENIINYILHIYDIKNDLDAHNNNSYGNKLNLLEEELEQIISNKSNIEDSFYIKVDASIYNVIKDLDYEYVGIIDIFVEIAELFGLFLYEEEEYTIGSDI